MSHTRPYVIALSGRTKAGKSTIATILAERLDGGCASFGAFVRAEARRRGRHTRREDLQDLGAELITEYGWDEFCRRTLAAAGVHADSLPCVVEGVRHVEALEALRALLAPVPVLLIHLDITDEERDERLAADGLDRQRGSQWESHSTERQVASSLPDHADLTVQTGSDPEATVQRITAWLTEIGPDEPSHARGG